MPTQRISSGAIFVDGAPDHAISPMDRGLAYGDGVFRTLRARNGVPLHWPRHYAKLARDCTALSITPPATEVLQREISAACGDMAESAVRIIVTRGVGERGYRYAGSETPTRVVMATPVRTPAPENRESGVRVRLCALKLSHQPALAGVKHLNRLENVLARAEWSDPAIAEGILCDVKGRVTGGTMTNLFMARDGALVTPTLDRCGVSGVTRERVIAAAAQQGVRCSVRTVTWAECAAADEVFLVNSLVGVWPVRELDGRTHTPGPLTRRMQQVLETEDDAQVG